MRDFRAALRFFLTQTGFRVLMLAAAFAFAGIFFYAYFTEVTNTGPRDMRAPFWEKAGKRPALNGNGEAGARRLEIQHLSNAEVGRKLMDMTAESLSFSPGDFSQRKSAMRLYFTPEAYRQYEQFLNNLNMASSVSQNLRSAVLFEQSPLHLSSGVFNGAYKWLFEVPVTISFTDVRGGAAATQNRRFTLKAQLTRVADPGNPDAIKIEIWEVLAPRG